MAFTPFNGAGGGAAGSDDCTATTAQWRSGYTAIGVGTDDEPANGGIQDYTGATSKTPSTVAQTFSTNGRYMTSDLTVAAIPNQKADSGNVTLSGSSTTKSYAAGYYGNAHGAKINTQTKSATPTVSAQTINADTNYVLTSVTVNAIPNQRNDSGNVSLTTNGASKSYAAGWYGSAHGAVVNLTYADW